MSIAEIKRDDLKQRVTFHEILVDGSVRGISYQDNHPTPNTTSSEIIQQDRRFRVLSRQCQRPKARVRQVGRAGSDPSLSKGEKNERVSFSHSWGCSTPNSLVDRVGARWSVLGVPHRKLLVAPSILPRRRRSSCRRRRRRRRLRRFWLLLPLLPAIHCDTHGVSRLHVSL